MWTGRIEVGCFRRSPAVQIRQGDGRTAARVLTAQAAARAGGLESAISSGKRRFAAEAAPSSATGAKRTCCVVVGTSPAVRQSMLSKFES